MSVGKTEIQTAQGPIKMRGVSLPHITKVCYWRRYSLQFEQTMARRTLRCKCLKLLVLLSFLLISCLYLYTSEESLEQVSVLSYNSIKRFFLYDVLDRDLAKQASVAPFNGSVGNNTKMILFYTTYFEHMPWPDFGYSMSGLVNFTDLQGNVCPIQEFKCSISYIHLDFNRSARWCFMDHGCLHYEG